MLVLDDSEKKNDFRDEETENKILVYCISIALQTSGQIEKKLFRNKNLFQL